MSSRKKTLLARLDANLQMPPDPNAPPTTPTGHPPGSVRKMFVIRQRCRLRQPLFNDADEQCIDTDTAATDRAFACAELIGSDGLREMLACARATHRHQIVIAYVARRRGAARVIEQLLPDEECSAPDWLAKEQNAWRERESARPVRKPPAPAEPPKRERPIEGVERERQSRVARDRFQRGRGLVAVG